MRGTCDTHGQHASSVYESASISGAYSVYLVLGLQPEPAALGSRIALRLTRAQVNSG